MNCGQGPGPGIAVTPATVRVVTADGDDPLQFLLGEWSGEGKGLWGDFSFEDSLSFVRRGRPWLEFRQLTTAGGETSHAECGFLMAEPGGRARMTVAEPSGITEALSGRVEGNQVVLSSDAIGLASGAKNVTATARRLRLEDDHLVVEVDVAMNGESLAPHTRSVLRRI